MNNIELIIFSKNVIKFDGAIYIDDFKTLQNRLNVLNLLSPRVVLVDIKYLAECTEKSILKTIKQDLMYKNASNIIYGEKFTSIIKENLYNFGIKGIIETRYENAEELISHVMLMSNLYSSSFKNNFIRGLSEYRGLGEYSKKVLYLFSFLVYKYKLSFEDASDIRLVFISLIIAFRENRVIPVHNLLHTVFKSDKVNRLYRNYLTPATLSEQILASLLLLCKNEEIVHFTKSINTVDIDATLRKEIDLHFISKSIIISSEQDLNLFWEETYLLDGIFEPIKRALIRFNYILVDIDVYEESINISLPSTLSDEINDYTKELSSDIVFTLKHSKKYIIICISYKAEESTVKRELQASCIDMSKIDTMHYEDSKKITAKEFLKIFEIDSELMEELVENEIELSAAVYKSGSISDISLLCTIKTLKNYASVLYEIVEFKDIANTITSLSVLFEKLDLEKFDKSRRETLTFYIQGIIADLSSWREHVFVNASTQDIHYLDASLLENSLEIENFILSKEDTLDDNDDDLEFF